MVSFQPILQPQLGNAGKFAAVVRDQGQSVGQSDGGYLKVIGTNRHAFPGKLGAKVSGPASNAA